MKKLACLLGIAAGTVMFLNGNPLISDQNYDDLMKTGKLSQTLVKSEAVEFKFTPDTELCCKATKSWVLEESPVFTTENLFYISKEQLKKNSKNPDTAVIDINEVSKIIRSISKMKGMIYYSNGDKKWEELYHKSYLIVSPKEKTPLPDNTEGSADGKQFYCLQEDNSLGTLVYNLEYSQNEKEVSVCFTLVEPLKIGPIVGVKANNLKINLVAIEQDEGFLLYMIIQSKYPHISIIENKLNKSFNARVDAIYDWFVKQF